ncbi:hypothetical protein MKZ38_009428 [Zalerion maritima]|uniref:Uncharacterized protein n=1 Tax=Zalerion maritima TaxID=339359 RepID=A0AAD5WMA8_9PEZI|nr:hypothetical protein MKZ38_009428 [Zalerion maritima]
MWNQRHYSYECQTGVQSRPYVPRPSRTQQLANPKLVPKLTNDSLEPEEKKKGLADSILAEREAARETVRRKDDEDDDDTLRKSKSRRRRRGRSPSADSRSPSPRPVAVGTHPMIPTRTDEADHREIYPLLDTPRPAAAHITRIATEVLAEAAAGAAVLRRGIPVQFLVPQDVAAPPTATGALVRSLPRAVACYPAAVASAPSRSRRTGSRRHQHLTRCRRLESGRIRWTGMTMMKTSRLHDHHRGARLRRMHRGQGRRDENREGLGLRGRIRDITVTGVGTGAVAMMVGAEEDVVVEEEEEVS